MIDKLTLDGKLPKESDLLPAQSRDDAIASAITKSKQFIDQVCERMFT